MTHLLIPSCDLCDIVDKKALSAHFHITMPSDLDMDIWSHYYFFQAIPLVLENHLVVVLHISLTDRSISTLIYQTCTVSILNPQLAKAFQYDKEWKCKDLLSAED